MSEQKFNIKQKGNSFVAFDLIDKKKSYGSINIRTGKFVGATVCWSALSEHLDKYIEETYNTPTNGIKYKLLVIIERINENGLNEELVQETPVNIGEFDTINEARKHMKLLSNK